MHQTEVLISSEKLQTRIQELAEEVRKDYEGKSLMLVGILKGSIHFLSDFARALGREEDELEFIQVSSYGAATKSSGVVQIRKDIDQSLEGRHVLLVEDIVDTGLTLSHLLELLSVRRPESLEIVTLLSKPEARKTQVPVKYVGFDIPNQFVIGYGLDAAEKYRNLADIRVVTNP